MIGRIVVALLLLLTACSQDVKAPQGQALIVVSAPLSAQPWVGRFVERGARLAAEQLNSKGGMLGRTVRIDVLDNGGSPQQVVAHARQAVAGGAVGMVIDGVGAVAVADVTDPANLPVFVVFEGGASLVDPRERPTLFRLAPANKPLSTRLSDYLSERAQRVALLSDDSQYGTEGAAQMRLAFTRNEIDVVADATVPQSSSDVAPQVLAARRSGAQALVVWARATGVAAVVRATRGAGWDVPIFTGPAGEDPLVRQRLADHPEWLDGLTFVSFRITSEVGPEPFAGYRKAYVDEYGEDEVGVRAGGRPVLAPPDWSMYAYDALQLLAAALVTADGKTGAPLMAALDSTVVTGANGDERGFGPTDREGVSPDDMYFARFKDMRFAPVTDDILSTGLPTVDQ